MARTNPGGAQSNPVPPSEDHDRVDLDANPEVLTGEQENDRLKAEERASHQNGDPAVDQEASDVDLSDEEFEPYVEWQGAVTYREITKEHWQQASVHDQETVTFSRDSRRVPLASLSEDAQNRLAGEPDFHFVTEPPKEDD